MYDSILVPVSFDDDRNASAALAVAKRLLKQGGKLVVMHVMEHVPAYAINYLPQGYRDDARTAIAGSLSDMAEGFDNVEAVVLEGHSGRTILDWAHEHQPGCIVIASHRPGMQDYFLGSTAAHVVRHAKCAVHVVR